MRFYVHLEEDPALTILVKPADGDSRTISDLAEEFATKYNAKFGSQRQLDPRNIKLLNARRKPLNAKTAILKVVSDRDDVYVKVEGGSTAAAPKPAVSQPAPAGPSKGAAVSSPASSTSRGTSEVPEGVTVLLKTAAEEKTQRNYRKALTIYEQLLAVDAVAQNEQYVRIAVRAMAEMYQANQQYAEAEAVLKKHLPAVRADPLLAKYYGDVLHALEKYQAALKEYKRAAALKQSAADPAQDPTLETLSLGQARSLYKMGEETLAGELVMTVLNGDQHHAEALFEYATITLDRGRLSDSIAVLLRLLVQSPESKQIKGKLADAVAGKEAVAQLLQELNNASSAPAALAFLATCLKEYGRVEEAVTLYYHTCSLAPSYASYPLNLAHALEILFRYQDAVQVMLAYCKDDREMRLGGLQLGQVLSVVGECPAADPQIGWLATRLNERGGGGPSSSEGAAGQLSTAKVDYNHEDLDSLAVLFTLVKVLFMGGGLEMARRLVPLLEPARLASKKPLHETLIRNEAAYYGCAKQLLADFPIPDSSGAAGPRSVVYLCGDSHCLTGAWRPLTMRGKEHTIVPLLSTGLKLWHLREASRFYPKVQFWNSMARIPQGASVVIAFGEIDCREGILVSVQRSKYRSVEHGIEVTIAIYMEVLERMVKEKDLEVFVHPVPPVLNETRGVVTTFNRMLAPAVCAAAARVPTGKLHFLDFEADLLTPDRKSLKAELSLDGTHLNPTYLQYLEKAVAACVS